MSDEDLALQLRTKRAQEKARRRRDMEAHPFGRHLAHEAPLDAYDDERPAQHGLLSFSGAARLLGVPPVVFYDQFADLDLHRLHVSRMYDDYMRLTLGRHIPDVAAGLLQRFAGQRSVVALGTSIGGFWALLLGTLIGARTIVVINPTTSLDPALLQMIGDARAEAAVSLLGRQQLAMFGEPRHLWMNMAPPRVRLHYSVGRREAMSHAQHLDGLDNVTLIPHEELAVPAKLCNSGVLRTELLSGWA